MKPPAPPDEYERLQALQCYGILDTSAEKEFDDLTSIAAHVCETPIALIALVDADRQYLKSKVGLEVDETPRDCAFSAYTILGDEPLVIRDATVDERFQDNPLVLGEPKVRFYAGAPLVTPGGYRLGSVCVLDRVPRELTREQLYVLQSLAHQVVALLNLRVRTESLQRKEQENRELQHHVAQARAKTERTAAANKAANTKLRGVIDNSSNFLGVLSLDGVLIDANRTALAAAGVELSEVLGKPFWETMWWSHSRVMQERLQQAVHTAAGGSVDKFDATHPAPDGSTIEVEFSLTPVWDDTGNVGYLIPEGRDVTLQNVREAELSRLNQELIRSNGELEQFAYIASHDLQEPLRKISAYAALLRDECGASINEEGHYFLDVVIDGAGRLKQLILDLLTFARINTERAELSRTDANSSLQCAIDSLEIAIAENGATVTHAPLPHVMADASHLTLLFQNLVANGLKYRRDISPVIHVAVRDLGAQYEFSVQDNGIGIEPQYFEKVFQIFKRLHGKSEYSGTGIGLALCKRIVERFDGKIWLESKIGSGSKFFFTLRKATDSPARPGAASKKARTEDIKANGENER